MGGLPVALQAGFTRFFHWGRRVNRCVEKILKKRVQGVCARVCARAVPCRHTGVSGWCLHPRKHAPSEEAWPPVFPKACAPCGLGPSALLPTQGRSSGAVRSSPSAVLSESCFVSAAHTGRCAGCELQALSRAEQVLPRAPAALAVASVP